MLIKRKLSKRFFWASLALGIFQLLTTDALGQTESTTGPVDHKHDQYNNICKLIEKEINIATSIINDEKNLENKKFVSFYDKNAPLYKVKINDINIEYILTEENKKVITKINIKSGVSSSEIGKLLNIAVPLPKKIKDGCDTYNLIFSKRGSTYDLEIFAAFVD
jgi:hypothetical protein